LARWKSGALSAASFAPPLAEVRDGKRALAMAKSLFEATLNLTVRQTYAMALAESGNFTEAAKLQQETIIGYERSGMRAPG
jgi:hypothetical protein